MNGTTHGFGLTLQRGQGMVGLLVIISGRGLA